jgi:hypothetical protein
MTMQHLLIGLTLVAAAMGGFSLGRMRPRKLVVIVDRDDEGDDEAEGYTVTVDPEATCHYCGKPWPRNDAQAQRSWVCMATADDALVCCSHADLEALLLYGPRGPGAPHPLDGRLDFLDGD